MAYLDPSIIMGFKPIEIPDQTNMLLKAMQIKSLMRQNRLQDFKVQDAEGDATQRNALMDMIKGPEFAGLDPTAQRSRVMQVAPTVGATYAKSLLDMQKSAGEMQKLDLDNHAKQISIVGQVFGAAANQSPQAVMDAFNGMPPTIFSPDFKKAHMAEFQADPIAAAKKFQAMALTAEQQMQQNNPTILPTDAGIAAVNKDGSGGRMVPNITGAASYANGQPGVGPGITGGAPQAPQSINQPYVGPQPAGSFAGDPATLYALVQRIHDPAARAQATRALQNQLAGANPTPDASGVFQGSGASGPVPRTSIQGGSPSPLPQPNSALGAKREEIVYHNDPLTGQTMELPKYRQPGSPEPTGPTFVGTQPGGKLSPADQAFVDKIVNFEMPPFNSSARNPRQMNIMAAVAEQHPDYDATQYGAKQNAMKAFSTGKEGAALRSFSVATDHLNSLGQLTDALNNGNIPLINKVANIIAANTGSTAPTTFDAAKEIVGKEVVKAIVTGGGGVEERARISELLSNAKTPAQLKAIINEYTVLMNAQRDGLIAQYENTTGRKDTATRFNFSRKAAAADGSGWGIEKVN